MRIKDLRFKYQIEFCDIKEGAVFVVKDKVYMKLKKNDWGIDAVDPKTGQVKFISTHEAVTPIPNAVLTLMDFVVKDGENDG